MTGKTGNQRTVRSTDRRSGKDRRKADVLRPGLRDRRRTVESRRPDVSEIEMSSSEWDSLKEEPPPDK